MTILLLLATLAQEEAPTLRLAVQLDTGAKDGIGIRKVTAEEGGAFARALEELPAVRSASWKPPVMTVVLESDLKFTDIKKATKSAKLPDGGHLQVVFNALRLEGDVTLSISVAKNADRVAGVIRSMARTREIEETADGYRFTIPKRRKVAVIPLIKAVAAKTGVAYRIFEILRNITWHAGS